MDHASGIIAKKSMPNPSLQRFSKFYSRKFIALVLIFRSLINYGPFIWYEVSKFLFFFLVNGYSCSTTICQFPSPFICISSQLQRMLVGLVTSEGPCPSLVNVYLLQSYHLSSESVSKSLLIRTPVILNQGSPSDLILITSLKTLSPNTVTF